MQIHQAFQDIEKCRQFQMMLGAARYSGFANVKAIDGEIKSQAERIERILRSTDLLQPMDKRFAGFFKNWKNRWSEANDLEGKKAALRWLLRRLKEIDSQPKVVRIARSN